MFDNMTRDEIRKRLEELAASAPPKDLSLGAMCYSMAEPPETAAYICPRCGERTLYGCRPSAASRAMEWLRGSRRTGQQAPAGGTEASSTTPVARSVATDIVAFVEWTIPSCREQVQWCRRMGLAMELDEAEFCERCRPRVEYPRLALTVQYGDQAQSRRVEPIDAEDVELIVEFLKGETKHDLGMAGEVPLKKYARRLAELLGIADR